MIIEKILLAMAILITALFVLEPIIAFYSLVQVFSEPYGNWSLTPGDILEYFLSLHFLTTLTAAFAWRLVVISSASPPASQS